MLALLTEHEVARRLHVSVASLRKWRVERRGPQFIKVGSLVRYREEALQDWLATLPTGGSGTSTRLRALQSGSAMH
jgi:excisionase family DNA binding protein